MSALVQQLLLAQGGAYASVVDERVWKQIAVLMQVPEESRYDRTVPAGSYLIVPWDIASREALEAYIFKLWQTGVRPDFVVIVTSAIGLHDTDTDALSARFDCAVAAVDIRAGLVRGHRRLSLPLDIIFDPDTGNALKWVNPLQHMSRLADPRDPRVFFERLRRASPRAWVTMGLIAFNVLVFIAMKLTEPRNFFGQFDPRYLVEMGANVGALTVGNGETWRLMTCTFLHADIIHIGFNVYALKVLGDTAERLFGSTIFVAIYLLAALGGSVASLGFTLAANPNLPSVGASGAVFGIIGALLGFALSRRGSVPPQVFRGLTRSAIMLIVINVGIGFAITIIDNAAHIGGLVVGLGAGLALSRDLPPAVQPSAQTRGARIAAIVLALIVGYWMAAAGVETMPMRMGM